MSLKRIEIASLLANPSVGETVLVKGWVRAFRSNRFIVLNDGSDFNTIQVVVDFENFSEDIMKKINFHAAIAVTGELVASQGAGQSVEILAKEIEILGECNPDEYVLQPKHQTMEYLRDKLHFRMRTQTMSAVFRIRHGVAFAVHKFFNDNGYNYIHTPIVTGNDAEGAGEIFHVSTFGPNQAPLGEDGNIDWSKDFFGKKTNLTVSGQLQGEIAAMALGKIYTFGPTFRAENSNTSRHLSEFWMIEPEMAFMDIEDNQNLAEAFCKYLIKYILDNYPNELKYLDDRIAKMEKNMKAELRRPMPLIETLRFVVDNDFERITYTEAIRLLKGSKPYKKGKFEFPVEWGQDLSAEHERWLVEKKFKKPVIVIDYPKGFKAFYMKMNDDNETVAGMDVLFPGIGEVIGGSERETRMDVLKARMAEYDIHEDELDWYLDLRKFGSTPHSGFGLGFGRMVQFITGMANIRDVIPFPRTPGTADF